MATILKRMTGSCAECRGNEPPRSIHSREPSPSPTLYTTWGEGFKSRPSGSRHEYKRLQGEVHDPTRSRTALGGTIPEWILESVVGSYFTFLHIREGFIHMDRQTYSHDPFGLDTTPYTLDDTEIERN